MKSNSNLNLKELDKYLERIYLDEIDNIPLLSHEEQKKLLQKISKGDKESKKKLIEANLRLVVSTAKKYKKHNNIETKDFIQEGNIGLMESIDKFNLAKNVNLSTYSLFWIIGKINRAIEEQAWHLKIPVNKIEKINKMLKLQEELIFELNREATIEEIAERMKISVAEVIELIKINEPVINLNFIIHSKKYGNIYLQELIPSSDELPDDIIIKRDTKTGIRELLQKCDLKKQELEVLIYRYGLDNNSPKTLDEISKILGKTRQAVSTIEITAIRKIRNSEYINEFAEYMDNPDKSMDLIYKYRELYTNNKNKNKYKYKMLTEDSIKVMKGSKEKQLNR